MCYKLGVVVRNNELKPVSVSTLPLKGSNQGVD